MSPSFCFFVQLVTIDRDTFSVEATIATEAIAPKVGARGSFFDDSVVSNTL